MYFPNSKNFFLAFLLITLSSAIARDDRGICPPSSSCDLCNTNWDHPGMAEEEVLIADDLCKVTFTWDWPFNETFSGPNPRLVFKCVYEDGELCNIGDEDVCASCEVKTLNGLRPSRNPTIEYSDTCGYVSNYEVARNCLPVTEPPTTTVLTTTEEPTTVPATTVKPTTVPATTAELTTEVETTTEIETTTVQGETTTVDSYYCPESALCNVCPDGWQVPRMFEEDFAVASDSCDVTLSWDSKLSSEEGGPRMGFSCIYAETGEYCDANIDLVCASCENTTVAGVQPSLKPFIHYTDSCNNSKDFNIAENCQFVETTAVPTPYCPDPSICEGCDPEWGIPSLQLTGTPLVNDTCDISVSWEYTFSPIEEIPNPRMTFQCIYESNGAFCEDGTQSECVSCEEVVFHNVVESNDPYINYSDTCGNLFRLNVGDVCN